MLAVVTADDLPELTYGRTVRDVPVLARGVVRYVGEKVAVVVAESRAAAEDASAEVDVRYDALPALTHADAALEAGARPVHERAWSYPGAVVGPEDHPNLQSRSGWELGEDVDRVLETAAHVVSGRFSLPPRHQGYLEPHVCTVRWDDEGAEVWAPNKSPYLLRAQLAAWLGVAPERIRVRSGAIGGDFGGKGSPMDVPLCAALARNLGRPVRMEMRYAEELMAGNPSHGARVDADLGLDADGRIVGLRVDVLHDGGAYAGYKPSPRARLFYAGTAGAPYRIPAVRITSLVAYTHTVPRGHIRTPGALEVTFAVESLIDRAAQVLGEDAVAFRRRNAAHAGDRGALGLAWREARVVPVLDAARGAIEALQPRPGSCTGSNDWWATGVGYAVFCQPVHAGVTEVELRPTEAGRLIVAVPFPDQGGGQWTVAREVVTRNLGVPAELVTVVQASQTELPDDFGVGASRVTVDASEALYGASAAARAEMDACGIGPAAGSGLEAWRAALAEFARATERPVRGRADHRSGPPLMTACAQAARVSVDLATGRVVVDDIVTAVDVADIIHEGGHKGQIEGGVVMGLGHALLEDLALEDGRVGAANLGEYKMPSARDVPRLTTVLVGGGVGLGRCNVKPIGEVSNVAVAPAIANAIAVAIGVRLSELPISAERVYGALQADGAGDG